MAGACVLSTCFFNQKGHTQGFDYSSYATALAAYVDDQGGVDYKGLKANPTDLEAYLKLVANLDAATFGSWSDREKIAFWCNAYNGLTLKAIIDNYPIQSSWTKSVLYPKNSIRQIDGVWDKLRFTVMGRKMTLEEIEHQELRAKFDEPRIHAALVCAANSCPPLRNKPFIASRLDDQLDDQMKAFLSHPTKFKVDPSRDVVYLSKIYKWFGGDFVGRYGTDSKFQGFDSNERAVLNASSAYIGQEERRFLETGRYKIKYLDYDWTLNEQ